MMGNGVSNHANCLTLNNALTSSYVCVRFSSPAVVITTTNDCGMQKKRLLSEITAVGL